MRRPLIFTIFLILIIPTQGFSAGSSSSDSGNNSTSFEIPGMPGANVGMINIGEMLGKSMGAREKKKKMSVYVFSSKI